MPTYEYQCRKNGHRFEVFQSINAEPLKKCTQCSSKVERLIGSGAGFIFKGSGFYQTDYRSSNYQTKAAKEKESHTKGADSKKETTPSSTNTSANTTSSKTK